MTGSVHLPCNDCGDPASSRINGLAFCDDCAKDALPMDFEDTDG